MFGKEVYIARRKALMERLAGEKGVALFLGNVEAPAQYKDNCYKWRQDSNWLYFFGIDEPRFAATIDLESGEETIYADDFSIDDIIWTGPMPSVQSQAEAVGVSRTAPYSALREAVRGRKVHFLPTSRYYNSMLMASLLGLLRGHQRRQKRLLQGVKVSRRSGYRYAPRQGGQGNRTH